MTHTRTHVYVSFANPYLRCIHCGERAEGYHDNERCGCHQESWNVPCEHPVGSISACPSWSPVDGCICEQSHG
jgi:hypothetical protein